MKKIIMPLLLLSAAFVTPAYANYFSNQQTGINWNIGSAPNPRPEDIRENLMPTVAEAPTPEAKTAASIQEQNKYGTVASGRDHNSTPARGSTGNVREALPPG